MWKASWLASAQSHSQSFISSQSETPPWSAMSPCGLRVLVLIKYLNWFGHACLHLYQCFSYCTLTVFAFSEQLLCVCAFIASCKLAALISGHSHYWWLGFGSWVFTLDSGKYLANWYGVIVCASTGRFWHRNKLRPSAELMENKEEKTLSFSTKHQMLSCRGVDNLGDIWSLSVSSPLSNE